MIIEFLSSASVTAACVKPSFLEKNKLDHSTETFSLTSITELGVAVAAYRIRDGVWTQLGIGDPRRPQSFYPIKDAVDIRSGDYLAARCTYDNPGNADVKIGNQLGDEMCNFYLMYAEDAAASSRAIGGGVNSDDGDVGQCHTPASQHFVANFPHDADSPGVASSPSRAAAAASDDAVIPKGSVSSSPTTTAASNLPVPQPQYAEEIAMAGLGQVGGLATDSAGRLVVFHRGSRRWNGQSFDFSNRFNPKLGPIADNTLALIDTLSGGHRVLQEWGRNLFFMPHGLTIDGRGRLWLTDVGAHQVS